jgi:T5SS/PEP-CTERM-associated repeat protein
MFRHPQRLATFALAVLLLAASAAHAHDWIGLSANWFSTSAWVNNGVTGVSPPSSADDALFFDSVGGFPLLITDVQLSASTTIRRLSVQSPTTKQYTFTGANGAVLTATQKMDFGNSDLQALKVHTIASLRLNTPLVEIYENAILSLNNATITTNTLNVVNNGSVAVNSGSSVQTLNYTFGNPAGLLVVNSGGELRVAGDTTLVRGTTYIDSGGQLNALSGVDLEYNGTSLLQFVESHTVDDGVHLKATGGGDISAVAFIDVGNGAVGSLTVTGAGSTLTAQSSVSDWGVSQSGNATVTISNSGLATVSALRAGTSSATFVGNITNGGTLRTTSTFRMGGGSTVRTVSLTVGGGTLETAGLATFDNQADLNLTSGTINFSAGATFNAGSRFDWSGGLVNLGAGRTLLVDGGTINRTTTSDLILTDSTTVRVRNNGVLTTPTSLILGDATLDMTGGFLTVGTTGGAISDWAVSGTNTTATLTSNSVATFNSGLRMGFSTGGGIASATISGGARLVANGSLRTGGEFASNVTLNVTGGRVESDGTIFLERGTTTNVSAAGVVDAQNVVLGSPGANITTTVTGAGSLLRAQSTLTAGRTGRTTLTVSAGGKAQSLGSTVIGELAGSISSTVNVTGSGSRLDVGSSLTVGGAGTGQLNIEAGGFVPVTGGVTVGSQGTLFLTSGGSLETSVGQSVVNNGVVIVGSGSQVRADVVSAGSLSMNGAGISRNVTLQANSMMNVDNAEVGSLTQQAGADINFNLRSAANFDDLTVTGAASLAGKFVFSLGSGFTPTAGMTFPIFTAASITGTPTFDFSAASLPSGLAWVTVLGPTTLQLGVGSVPVLNGDYNQNNFVDAADYTKWRDNVGSNNVLPNDPTGGTIGAAQYNTWRTNFGQSGNMFALAAAASVPEPTSVVLMLTLVITSRIAWPTNLKNGGY